LKQLQKMTKIFLLLPVLALLTLTACDEAETVDATPMKEKAAPEVVAEKKVVAQKKTVASNSDEYATSVSGYVDRFIGNADAPVTMIEYASYTCPHCANFHIDVLPKIKKNFVDTGKVKVIFRDFPFEQIGATAAMLSRCVTPARYAGFHDLLMKQQSNWAHSNDPMGGMFKLAKLAGLSQANIESCLSDEKMLDQIVAVRKEAMDVHGFNSTPSFLINGEKVIGGGDYERFKSIIEGHL